MRRFQYVMTSAFAVGIAACRSSSDVTPDAAELEPDARAEAPDAGADAFDADAPDAAPDASPDPAELAWTEAFSDRTSPTARNRFAMAYDGNQNRVVRDVLRPRARGDRPVWRQLLHRHLGVGWRGVGRS